MQTTPKANNILGHFFALLGAVVMLAIATWVSASSSEQVQPLDNLATPRTGHTATALSDGRILITGGRDTDGNLVAASEIFDPETQTSSASAALHTARVDHSATVLADGRVLIAGGTGASGALSSAEIFDPANPGAGFQVVASPMTAARTHHTATLLNNGTVLIAGGETAGTAEIFDPTTQSFTPTLWNLQVARSGHTATLFTDDSVLLAGGNTATMETYTPGQGFSLDAATMSIVRTGHWAFELSDTRLLLFQGDTGNSIDEFNPTSGTITPKGSLEFHASSSSLLANGKVLVLGTDAAGLYNPDAVPPAPDFTAFDETSVPHSGMLPRSGQSAVTLPGDKKILITGGVDASNQLLGQALFNPAKIWTDKDDYQPADPVILSGSGWKANENVYLYAVDNETEQWTYEMTTPADANGGFVLSPYFIVELRHLGVQFYVTALGAQSTMQADVYFTDASHFNAVTVGAETGVATAGTAASPTYTVTATYNGGGSDSNDPVTLTFDGWIGTPPTGVSTGFSTTSVTNASPTSTLTINTSVSTLKGVYQFTVRGTQTSGGATFTGQGTLTVLGPPTITSANNTTFTVDSLGSFNVTATGGPAPTFSETGALPSGVTFTSAGVLSGTPASGTFGTYPITITATNGVLPNATQAFTLTVQKVTTSFNTLTASQSIVYGQSPISLSGKMTGYPNTPGPISITINGVTIGSPLNGTPNNFGPVSFITSTIPASVVPYPISYAFGGDINNLATTNNSTTLTVNKANTSTAITSDLPDPSTTVQVVHVNYQVSVTAPGAGTPTGNVHVSDGVDSCDGTVAAGGCDLTLTTVGARTLTATYAGDTNFNGSTSPGAPHTVNPGTVNTTTTVTSSLNPSTYGQNVTFTAKVTAASGTNNPTGTVQFVIDGSNSGAPVTLGSCSPTVAGTACASISTSTLPHTVSPHIISASYAPGTGFNTSGPGLLPGGQVVNTKAASVTPDAATKEYGAVDPALTGTLTGFLAGDGVTATYSRTTGETVAGGPYTISATLSPVAALSNYNITYNTANFTITTRSASVTPDAASKEYGAVDPALTGTLSGFLAADGVTATYSRTAGETVAGGPYTISAMLSPAGVLSNYNITYNTASFTITPKAASVTPNAASKTYGAADPAFTGTLSGFLAADGVTATYSRTAGETVLGSPYTISAMLSPAGVLSNYSITYNTANFTINTKAASVTPNAASKTYGAADPAFTGTLSGFLAADGVTATYSRTAGETVLGSPYTISAMLSPAGVLSNYSITYNTANFTINPKAATWTTNPNSKAYLALDPNPLTTGSGSGFLAADSVTATYSRASGELPGTYHITATLAPTAVLPNYNITNNGADFTIGYGMCTGSNGPGGVILQPINADGSSVFPKAGRTVPVKFTVCDANGNPISDPNAVFAGTGGALTMLGAVRGQLPQPDESQYNDIPDAAFRYSSGIWIFNMSTSNLQSGYSYTFRINLANGHGITFVIAIK